MGWSGRRTPARSTRRRSPTPTPRTSPSSSATPTTPGVAFAREDRNWYTDEFLAPPEWAHVFGDLGFTVLSRAQLTTALSAVDTSVLTRAEWRQVRAYGITTLGGVLFNAWA